MSTTLEFNKNDDMITKKFVRWLVGHHDEIKIHQSQPTNDEYQMYSRNSAIFIKIPYTLLKNKHHTDLPIFTRTEPNAPFFCVVLLESVSFPVA